VFEGSVELGSQCVPIEAYDFDRGKKQEDLEF